MKKLLFMLTLVMSVVLTSCKDDECDHNLSSSSGNDLEDTVVGNWYEEELNEEVHLGENGTFYDRFANYQRCAQTEGQYEYDSKNKKLTYRYLSMGQTRAIDWTVRNKSEMGFVISSPKQGEHKQEKIVEEYELKVGETVNIKFPTEYPDYSVISYASNNPRIASVTSEGGIKAEGEKGITYIKVSTTTCNVWVKVTVGDNCADLWHDYVGLLDLDYNGMRKALSMLGEPIALEDDYSFAFPHTMHDVADMTIATLCPEEGIVIQVQLWIKESVPEAEILSYLNSRYYKFAEVEGMIFYYSEAQVETSKSIIGYSRATKRLLFGQTEHALHPHVADLWPDFIPMFGNTKSQVKSTMDKKGFTFAMSDYEYSKNGLDYYLITGNEYAWLVGFVFNPDDQVCEFWVYMDRSTDPEVYDYLRTKYNEKESERTETLLIFYNKDNSMKVTFDLVNGAVVYTNLTMKQHEANNEILGSYYEGLFMTMDEIIAKYGEPLINDDTALAYIINSDYVEYAFFYKDKDPNNCYGLRLVVKEGVSPSVIVDYLNSKYVVFASGTSGDGSKYAWTDGPDIAHSSLGVVYTPEKRYVDYSRLSNISQSKSRGGFDIDMELNSQTISKINEIREGARLKMERINTHKSQQVEAAIERFMNK